MLGGITGLMNASVSMNQVVHNTTFIPGHFHMTVGTAVALSIMGIAYWLVPWLTGRQLVGRKLAVAQGWVYAIGVLIRNATVKFTKGEVKYYKSSPIAMRGFCENCGSSLTYKPIARPWTGWRCAVATPRA